MPNFLKFLKSGIPANSIGQFLLTSDDLPQPPLPDEPSIPVLHERLILVLVFFSIFFFFVTVSLIVVVVNFVVIGVVVFVVVAVLIHVHAVLVVIVGFRRWRQSRRRARDVQRGAGRQLFRLPVRASVLVRTLADPEPLLAPPAADFRTSSGPGQ